jgi:hypothetical protein
MYRLDTSQLCLINQAAFLGWLADKSDTSGHNECRQASKQCLGMPSTAKSLPEKRGGWPNKPDADDLHQADFRRSLLKIPYSPWRSHISNESETQPACGSRESRERNLPMYACKRDCSCASSKAQEDAARCAMDSGFSGSPSFIAVV